MVGWHYLLDAHGFRWTMGVGDGQSPGVLRFMDYSKSSSKMEVYSNTILPQETRKTSYRQPNFTPKTTRKRRTKNPKISRRKEIIKIRA